MFLLLFLPLFLFASIHSIHNKEYNSLFNFSDLVLKTKQYKKLKFNNFDIKKCKTKVDLDISNRLDLAKYEYYNNDLGLYVNAGGNINDKNLQQSLYAGITWKLWNEGYKQHKNQAQIIYLQNRLNKLNHQQLNHSFSYFNDYNFIIYSFNKKKIILLDKYLKYLNLKYQIFKNRYFLHRENLTKLLLIKQSIENIKNLQNTYKIFNEKVLCKNEINGTMPMFDLNYKTILNDIKDINKTKKIKLNNEIINKKYDKFNDWTFNLYVNRELLSNQGDNIGFTLTIPLFRNPEQIKKIEKLKVISNLNENQDRLFLYLQKNYYIFKYKLSGFIQMKFKLAYVETQLKRAKLRYKFKIGSTNLDRIISNIDSIFAIKLQLLDFKQQLLLQSYSLLYNLKLPFKNKYVKEVKMDTNLHLRKGNRSLYIWANGFKKYENSILIELLKLKNIKTVLISVSKYEDFHKLEKFLILAKQNNIKVVFLIGNNSWIWKKNRKEIDRKLTYLRKYYNFNINLDIEPQAIFSLKYHREKYLKMYVEMLEYINKNYPMYKIDISIPTFYDPKMVNEMAKYVDKIYLMAYEYKDISHLIKRVNKYEVLKNKLVVVFNCKEFKNELELELNIEDFMKKSGYKNISLHNLKEYIKVTE